MTPEAPQINETERQGFLPDKVYELVSGISGSQIQIESPFDTSERVRLSRGARIHIRRLKQAGDDKGVDEFREREKQKKIRLYRPDPFSAQEVEDLLNTSVSDLLSTESRVSEILLGLKVVHLARAAGYISNDEMMDMSRDIFDMNLLFEDEVSGKWLKVKEEISHLLPKK